MNLSTVARALPIMLDSKAGLHGGQLERVTKASVARRSNTADPHANACAQGDGTLCCAVSWILSAGTSQSAAVGHDAFKRGDRR